MFAQVSKLCYIKAQQFTEKRMNNYRDQKIEMTVGDLEMILKTFARHPSAKSVDIYGCNSEDYIRLDLSDDSNTTGKVPL